MQPRGPWMRGWSNPLKISSFFTQQWAMCRFPVMFFMTKGVMGWTITLSEGEETENPGGSLSRQKEQKWHTYWLQIGTYIATFIRARPLEKQYIHLKFNQLQHPLLWQGMKISNWINSAETEKKGAGKDQHKKYTPERIVRSAVEAAGCAATI